VYARGALIVGAERLTPSLQAERGSIAGEWTPKSLRH
jgi:hypothetical protein